MKIKILTHSRSSIALRAVRSRTATSPLYIVHCQYLHQFSRLKQIQTVVHLLYEMRTGRK